MKKTRATPLFFSLLTAFFAFTAHAQTDPAADQAPQQPQTLQGGAGDLLIAPTRVVLDSKTRASEVNLTNRGTSPATYRISLVHMHQQADGSYKELTPEQAKATLQVADELLRFSPRQVTLKAGESQVVKIMMRKPEGLADGEYTSHMAFRAVPDLATGEDVEAAKSEDGKISVRIVPVYGVTIPVIVRNGTVSAQAKIESAARAGEAVNVTISRTGNASTYGDLLVTQGSSDNIVGQMRGVSILSYSPRRSVAVPVSGANGPLTVEFRQRMEEGGKILDKATVN